MLGRHRRGMRWRQSHSCGVRWRHGRVMSLVAQMKVNILNIWPNINTLISSFNFLGGLRGLL